MTVIQVFMNLTYIQSWHLELLLHTPKGDFNIVEDIHGITILHIVDGKKYRYCLV